MKFLRNNIANLITVARINLSLVLISLIPLSKEFLIIYTLCGFTDVIDGYVARKLNIVSRFGSILDSMSDLIFYSVMIVLLWVPLHRVVPLYIWIGVWVIIGFRLFLYLYVAFHFKEFLSNHTYFNKATGFLVFLLPYSLYFGYAKILAIIILVVALCALLYEFKIVGDKYETN